MNRFPFRYELHVMSASKTQTSNFRSNVLSDGVKLFDREQLVSVGCISNWNTWRGLSQGSLLKRKRTQMSHKRARNMSQRGKGNSILHGNKVDPGSNTMLMKRSWNVACAYRNTEVGKGLIWMSHAQILKVPIFVIPQYLITRKRVHTFMLTVSLKQNVHHRLWRTKLFFLSICPSYPSNHTSIKTIPEGINCPIEHHFY